MPLYFKTLLYGTLVLGSLTANATAQPVTVTVGGSVLRTIGPNFTGLQYNGPTHRAIDPATGQLADFPSAYATASTQRALTEAGVGMVRVFVDVPAIHPSPGEFNWESIDVAVAEIEASGMRPMLTLHQRDGTWFVGDQQQPWWTYQTGRDEWAVLAETLAQRYRDRAAYYEILNEPNHLHASSSSYMGWDQSVDLYLAAAEAIHGISPELSVGGPASYGSWEPATWAKKVIARSGGAEQLDFVSYHIYGSGSASDEDTAIFDRTKLYETAPVAIRQELLAATSKPIELALTEFNASSVWTLDGSLYTDPRNVDARGGLVAALGWLYSARGGADMVFRFGTTGGFGLIKWPPEYELQGAYHAVRLIHEVAGLEAGAELLAVAVEGGPPNLAAFSIRNGVHEAVILINTGAAAGEDVRLQFPTGSEDRALEVYRYGADRLESALELWTHVDVENNAAQISIGPQSLVVLRDSNDDDADFDNDGDVDGQDFLLWQRGLGAAGFPATNAWGNADGDDDVDGRDLSAWRRDFASVEAEAAGRVPEPCGFALVVGGLIGMAALLRDSQCALDTAAELDCCG